MTRGRFIVLEGGEGAGKSTQARALAARLAAHGHDTHVTREVGGAPLAEDIRALWLADRKETWDPVTELLLIMAARREHLAKTVWPKLEAGVWVVSDRFNASTVVYQGIAMELGRDKVEALYKIAAGDFAPDLTLLLDLPVETGRKRIAARRLDRYERKSDDFHEALRRGYLRLAEENPAAWRIVDAGQDVDGAGEQIWGFVKALVEDGTGLLKNRAWS